MLPLWGLVCGVLLGSAGGNFGFAGWFGSGFIGLLLGLWLQKLIRSEIAAANQKALEDIDARIDALERRSIAAPQPEPAPDRPVPEAIAQPIPRPIPSPIAAPIEPQEPAPPPEPAEPSILETAFAAARNWLFGGNTIVRLGLVILFVGLSFLASYAASAGLFPIELRLALVGIAGIALLVIGFNRRTARPDFALALQGVGVATLYLVLFAAARLYGIIPILPAFVLMVVVCALGCALALLQNAQSLAAASFLGGFAVPVLLSTGQGEIAVLFGYYTVLGLGVLALARQRAWRIVNLIGFFATFGVATVWGILSYQPANYAVAQGFLAAFVLIYVSAALLYERRMPGLGGGFVDSTLLFGPALAGFALQVGLVRDIPFGSAFSALGFGALYLVLAKIASSRNRASPLLTETLIAICIGFITLAIPLALGARWTSSAWAIEGAGAFWVGMRQARWLPRLFGLLLQAVAAFIFLATIGPNIASLPFIGGPVIGALLVAAPIIAVAWWLRRPIAPTGSRFAGAYAAIEHRLGAPWFLAGFGLAVIALALEANRLTPPLQAGTAPQPVFTYLTRSLLMMLGYVAAAWAAAQAGWRRNWPVATWPARAALLPLAIALAGQILGNDRILGFPSWALWLAALALHVHYLHSNGRRPEPQRFNSAAIHIGSVWLVTVILADCLWAGIDAAGLWHTSWASVVLLVSAAAMLVLLAFTSTSPALAGRWPMQQHAAAYRWTAALPLAVIVYAGTLITAVVEPGRTAPLPYIPLLNPVELALAIALAALLYWRRALAAPASLPAIALLAGLGFVVINTFWLRIAHHFLGVAFSADAMLESFIVQAGLAILWTLLALGLMLAAHRRQSRTLWLTGAGLLALVTAKLFLVDLSNANGGARVVTFIAVGALMLVVGYFAPLPPRTAEPTLPENA